jgi:molybdopterin-containing oxidoreductase family membrane subunit
MSSVAVRLDTDNTGDDPRSRAPLTTGGQTMGSVTDIVSGIAERRPSLAWYVAFAISAATATMFGVLILYLITTGIGVWGNNHPVYWAFDITNFVFWIGIGHAGTLISAILFLFRQKWRTSINRFAEAMTIFAVICALVFPGIHMGRIWLAYWMAPYPNQMSMWPQFRSPLMWDVFAVSTYFIVSLLFWYLGLIPDLATLRDRATSKWRRWAYGAFAVGWRGSARQWHVYERAYLFLAALGTPLVLSVHSVVSTDFSVGQVPGWHATIFPPYFVAGAIFSGFGMVITLLVPARAFFGFKEIVTVRHLDNITKVILATSLMVAYSYGLEIFIAWYGGNAYEMFVFLNRATGPYAWAFWTMVTCNVVVPHAFWFKWARTTPWFMWIVAVLVNVGMWFERFVIIVTSLSRDFLPSSWGSFTPTWVDIGMLVGSFGLFFTLFLLFCRYLPLVAVAEVKQILPNAHGGDHH